MSTIIGTAADALGFHVLSEILKGRQAADAPCPECGPRCTTKANARKRVLRIWDKGDRFLTFNCARCGIHGHAAEGRDWRKSTPPGFKPRHAPIVVPDADQLRRVARAMSLWRGATNPRGTVVETYLGRRGLRLGEDLAHVLRFHGGLAFDGELVPGMVALMRDAVTDAPCGLHRTFLDRDGRKLGRKMLGRAKGAAIKIDAHEDVTMGLHLGEGVETVLAARQLGYRPAWAVGSAGAIAAFPVLAGIDALSVFTENDEASGNAARTACARFAEAGAETWICKPPAGDMNDVVREAV